MYFHTLQIGEKFFRIVQFNVFDTNNTFKASVIVEKSETVIDMLEEKQEDNRIKSKNRKDVFLHGDYAGQKVSLNIESTDREEASGSWVKIYLYMDKNTETTQGEFVEKWEK